MNLLDSLKEQKTIQFLAKKIIVASPFSVKYNHLFLSDFIRKEANTIDENIQRWALYRADFFSESDWREIQLKKLKNILIHANRNVSYWQKLFKKIDFNPEKFKYFDSLMRIPILNRKELKKIPVINLLAKNIDRKRIIEKFTSGSTGEPLRFFQDKADLFLRQISTYDTFRWMNSGANDRICILGLEGASNLRNLGTHISMPEMESEEFRKNIYFDLMNYRPELLMGTPAHLSRMLHFFQKDKIPLKIKSIIYVGESMDYDLHSRLKEFFSAKIFSAYGAREASPLGIDCSGNGHSLHIVPWMNYLEFIEGKIIVTNFQNMVMPFIRYEVGDYGSLSDIHCQCGRQLPILNIEGRILGDITFSDGTSYPVNHILAHFTENYFQKIERMQIEQRGFTNLIFKYKPIRQDFSDLIEKEGREYLKRIFGNKIKASFEIVDHFLPDKNGKTSIFIKNKA